MKNKKWIIAGFDEKKAKELSHQASLSYLVAAVLCARGIETPKDAVDFLDTDIDGLNDPFLLEGIETAVREIKNSIDSGEKIAVYGDYDVDGITATCVLTQYLKSIGADCVYYIPDRLSEGYGLNNPALDQLCQSGVKLLITVDSGITAMEEIEYAKKLGLKVIVTDHHECKEVSPDALAVINPRIPGSRYPFRNLAGVGVALKLICALAGPKEADRVIDEYIDLVAVGTVADVMPLVSENRIIVSHGVRKLERTKNLGLRMLMAQSGVDKRRLSTTSISFILAPRINAAGRLGEAGRAARLFMTDDAAEADALALELCEQNRKRQIAENEILVQVLDKLNAEYDPERDKVIVLWEENWHTGVIGIVASRIADRFGVPCILITFDNSGEIGKGSGRSVCGFNLFEALENAADCVDKFGGHELAVGLSIERGKLEEFRDKINRYAETAMAEETYELALEIDCEIAPEQISIESVKELYALEPYGLGNQQPVFLMQNMYLEEIIPIQQNKHVKMKLVKNNLTFYALLFGLDKKSQCFVEGYHVDVAFSLEINSFRNIESVQFIIRDIRLSENEQKADRESLANYIKFFRGEILNTDELAGLEVGRGDLVSIWRHMKTNACDGVLRSNCSVLCRKIERENKNGMTLGRLMLSLDIFRDCALIDYSRTADELFIEIKHIEGKAELSGARTLLRMESYKKGVKLDEPGRI